MYKNPANYLTAFFGSIMFYLIACAFHSNITPTDIQLIGARVYLAQPQTTQSINISDPETKIRRGDTLMLTFRIHRYVSGLNTVNRIVVDGGNKSWIVSTATRDWTGGQVQIVEGQFPIPTFVTPGCRALAYSQNYYSYRWNVLTYMVPIVVNSPKIQFCIE